MLIGYEFGDAAVRALERVRSYDRYAYAVAGAAAVVGLGVLWRRRARRDADLVLVSAERWAGGVHLLHSRAQHRAHFGSLVGLQAQHGGHGIGEVAGGGGRRGRVGGAHGFYHYGRRSWCRIAMAAEDRAAAGSE